MENHRPQQNRQEPRPQAVLPPLEETPFRAHLYRSSVVGITDERMRQLAEHFVP